jgi:hypothetical protein
METVGLLDGLYQAALIAPLCSTGLALGASTRCVYTSRQTGE